MVNIVFILTVIRELGIDKWVHVLIQGTLGRLVGDWDRAFRSRLRGIKYI